MLNCTFSSGIVPDSWLLRNIKPINKNKGNPLNPKHFRPITILSWFGKHFTSILLKRLNHYSEQFSVLGESQLLWNIKPMSIEDLIYSFTIKSSPLALSFFKYLTQETISSLVISSFISLFRLFIRLLSISGRLITSSFLSLGLY
jgi:hypothetical protein